MTPRRLLVFDTTEELFQTAARSFMELAREAIAQRDRFVVALAGGSTPRRLYELLADRPYREQIDWPRLEIFWNDERAVPADHAESNYRLAWDTLLTKVPVNMTRVHRIPAETPEAEHAAAGYQQEIAEALGVPAEGPPPRFDLILLGIGEDGHTASLFPYTDAIKESTRWVVANDVSQREMHRLTMTLPILNRARHIIFLVTGESKAAVVREILEGPQDLQRLPSQGVLPRDGQLRWFLDRQAAANLQRRMPTGNERDVHL